MSNLFKGGRCWYARPNKYVLLCIVEGVMFAAALPVYFPVSSFVSARTSVFLLLCELMLAVLSLIPESMLVFMWRNYVYVFIGKMSCRLPAAEGGLDGIPEPDGVAGAWRKRNSLLLNIFGNTGQYLQQPGRSGAFTVNWARALFLAILFFHVILACTIFYKRYVYPTRFAYQEYPIVDSSVFFDSKGCEYVEYTISKDGVRQKSMCWSLGKLVKDERLCNKDVKVAWVNTKTGQIVLDKNDREWLAAVWMVIISVVLLVYVVLAVMNRNFFVLLNLRYPQGRLVLRKLREDRNRG